MIGNYVIANTIWSMISVQKSIDWHINGHCEMWALTLVSFKPFFKKFFFYQNIIKAWLVDW